MSIVLLTEPFSGGGSGSGTVTSIDVVGGTTGLTTSGGPVTTAGVITIGGTLGVPNGGTGTISLTGILKGTGTTPITIATAGTDYQAPITLTTTGTSGPATFIGNTLNIPQYTGGGGGGSGTVTSVSVVSSNGLAGTVANPTTTPAITLSTTVTGLLKGNGTSISAATSGADYAPATSGTSILYADGAGGFSSVTIGSGLTFSTGTLSATGGGGGSGTVTSVSVLTANGFAGTVANATTTPAITLSTSITGLLKGNGTAVSAASAGTDYQAPITLTTTGTSGAATFVGNTLNIPQYSGGGGGGSPNLDGGTPTSNYGGITAIDGGTP